MKKTALLSLSFFLFFSTIVIAQARIGSFLIYGKHKNLSKKSLEKFANSPVTYFIFEESDKYTKEDYEKLLKQVWKFTPYKIIQDKDIDNTIFKEGTSYARFRNYIVYSQGISTRATSSYHYLDFSVITKITKDKIKKGKRIFDWRADRVGAIYFTADIPLRRQVVSGQDSLSGDLMNYRLGYLKNYLQFVNSSFEKKESFDTFDDYINKEKIGVLKNKTLYFSQNFIYSYSGKKVAKAKKQITEEELFIDYQHKYEVIPDAELNEKILNDEDFYYLVYHQNAFIKVLSIINSKTGEVIYSKSKMMSYNLKPKDLKEISKKISKY
ncbi:hypothetical protein H2O64_09705 [Kordia sp. YSTF-M3]|uniref:Uncharacterized protein n=1 Tax=Kordia aestuariivivens TaxID=2759037 RepID=A0ABR7Q8R7_9FLAO|nr:hypothetical protein [Kordia aestuariivivens]MBC8754945.1 hypothetical protein [Kordia aestuariivivens]